MNRHVCKQDQNNTAVHAFFWIQAEGRRPQKSFMNNKVGLLAKLDEIKLPDTMPWIETLDFTTARPSEVEDAQDDLKREAEL